jgi:hypothetical protein
VLCLLANAKPKHFVTGADIALAKDHFSDLKDPNAHHIFPNSFLRKVLRLYVEEVHLLANFCFLPEDLNNKIKDRPPSEYFAGFRGPRPASVRKIRRIRLNFDATGIRGLRPTRFRHRSLI